MREEAVARGISALLPPVDSGPWRFPLAEKPSPCGSFLMVDEETMLASPVCSSVFPNGFANFSENRKSPPSRAYRKLWEAFTVAGVMPKPGERCIDAGASPGGWTWVLAKLGARVTSVDRAPLAPWIGGMENVEYREGSAFSITPREFGDVDWLFSDVICYPSKLYEWVSRWLDHARNLVCTIKMQGSEYDGATTAKFASIPGSRVVHLWHNKHELTWMLIRD